MFFDLLKELKMLTIA